MTRGLPGWFRALFTVVMLTLCAVLVSQLVYQTNAQAQISDLTLKLDTASKRLAKQQAEYDRYVAQLPQVQAELAQVAPQAEAAQTRKNELKAQCSALTAENKVLSTTLADLQAQAITENTEYFCDDGQFDQTLKDIADKLDAAIKLLQN